MKWFWILNYFSYKLMREDSLETTKNLYSGRNTLWISEQLEDNIGIYLGGLMKFNSPFTSLRNATSDIWRMHDFNYKLPKEEKQDYWEKECIDHPTSSHCKVY